MAADSQKPKSDERKRPESRPRNENMGSPETIPHDGGSGQGSNSIDRGCLLILAIFFVLGLILTAILYLGIPLGIVGILCCGYVYLNSDNTKKNKYDPAEMRRISIFIAIGSAILAGLSIAGNYYDKDAPFYSFMHPGKITKSSSENGAD